MASSLFLMPTIFQARVARLQANLREQEWDAMLISHLPNIYYLTGFSGSAGVALVKGGRVTLFTDGRYRVQARKEAAGCAVRIVRSALLDAVAGHLRDRRAARVAIEASHLTVSQNSFLRRRTGRQAVRHWIAASGVVEGLRAKKDASEVATLKAAAAVGCKVLEGALPMVRPGIREVDLAAEIEYLMRRHGASGPAFETIVASGPRTALPHARPTVRKLRRNELVVLDLGVILGHYCSDLTRTVYLGKPPRRMAEWHRAVQEAHEAAAAALRPGITGHQVDAVARGILKQHGLERLFIHSVGHGLGLEIHEEPRLARNSETPLEAGNVVTIEPGVYLEGTGGIRIEDDYAITNRGAERLTRTCRHIFQH